MSSYRIVVDPRGRCSEMLGDLDEIYLTHDRLIDQFEIGHFRKRCKIGVGMASLFQYFSSFPVSVDRE